MSSSIKDLIRRFLMVLGFAAFLAFLILINHHVGATSTRPAAKTVKHTAPCTTEACIQITQADGQKYKLNDFKFLPGHCIMFISMPDGGNRQTCGDYHLEWIGPDGSNNSQVI